jgi:2-isopropylmalate synthase
VRGPAARTDGATVRWHRSDVARIVPSAVPGALEAQAVVGELARALGMAAAQTIEVCSLETTRTVHGGWAAFVGCRVGGDARHGVGVHDDAATASADALISAVNRFAWEREARQDAA